jgi:SAM-dependent methyltransferase
MNMMRKRGLKIVYTYFFETHFFDLIRGTDTHTWLPADHFDKDIGNLEHGTLYMCSWTSSIKKATNKAQELSKFSFADADFIDVGCGKGKVVMVWDNILDKNINITGIDYSGSLVSICKNNLAKIGSERNIDIIESDITKVDFNNFKNNIVIYMFHPFDEEILSKFLFLIRNKSICLIYINPEYEQALVDDGFDIAYEQKGWHPNFNFTLFVKNC